jgi:hypothetical protein
MPVDELCVECGISISPYNVDYEFEYFPLVVNLISVPPLVCAPVLGITTISVSAQSSLFHILSFHIGYANWMPFRPFRYKSIPRMHNSLIHSRKPLLQRLHLPRPARSMINLR